MNLPLIGNQLTVGNGPDGFGRSFMAVKEEENEDDDDIKLKLKSTYPQTTKGQYPFRQKSNCCAEVLLVSLADLINVFEDQVGFKCDEAFLEDSALKLHDLYLLKFYCVIINRRKMQNKLKIADIS